MGIWTLDSPFSLITLDRRTRLLLLLRNLNQSRLEAVRLISGCKCHQSPNLYLYFVAVELLIQVVLYQITLFRYQFIHNLTTDYRLIYEDLQKLFRIGDPFWISEEFVCKFSLLWWKSVVIFWVNLQQNMLVWQRPTCII